MQKFLPELRIVWPIKSLDAIVKEPKKRTAIVLAVDNAKDFEIFFLESGLANRLVQSGTELFVLIGKESEQAHDALDWVLSDIDAEGILTSWHDESDLEDTACFVGTSCKTNNLNRLLLVIDESKECEKKLKKSIMKNIKEQ